MNFKRGKGAFRITFGKVTEFVKGHKNYLYKKGDSKRYCSLFIYNKYLILKLENKQKVRCERC